MKIIKEFSEFKEGPKDTTLWSVEIRSHANTQGLSHDEIDKIFKYYNHPEYLDFKSEMKKSDAKYDEYPVAKWQLSKSAELENLFFNSLTFEIKDDVAYAAIKFEISFTDGFDRGDVIGWTEGFSRFAQLVTMIHGYNLVNKIDTGETYEKEFEFTKDLIRNQKWKVEKID